MCTELVHKGKFAIAPGPHFGQYAFDEGPGLLELLISLAKAAT